MTEQSRDSYRSECHFEDCDMQFLGAGRSTYVEHLREDHGDLVADIYENLVVSKCEDCSVTYASDSGNCPSCTEADGIVRGELLD